jgi:hypothetical protein
VPSLPQVLAENGLPGVAPLSKGERVMLDRERLDTFYRELQTPSRIEANAPTPQVEEGEEDTKSQLTPSWVSEVRRDVVAVHRVGQGHPRLILQGESDIVLPEQVCKFFEMTRANRMR